MSNSSRITMRRTTNGVTIRATGSAANALFRAICSDVETAKKAATSEYPPVLCFQVVVCDRNNTYEARAIKSITAEAAGLTDRRATCTAGRSQAIEALLAKGVPPRRTARIVEQHIGPGRRDTYTIEAEVA